MQDLICAGLPQTRDQFKTIPETADKLDPAGLHTDGRVVGTTPTWKDKHGG